MYPTVSLIFLTEKKTERKKKEVTKRIRKKDSLSNLQKVWFTVILQSVSRRLMKRYDYFRVTSGQF